MHVREELGADRTRPGRLLDACGADHLGDEIAAEGLIRNLPAFTGFLDTAALGGSEWACVVTAATGYIGDGDVR